LGSEFRTNDEGDGGLHPVEQRLALAWPPATWQQIGVILAVSGGADSLALLRGMHRLKRGGEGSLIVAHFNHRLRGGESDGDAAAVVEVCQRLGIKCEVGIAEEGFELAGNGLESAARSARFRFLEEVATRRGARYVVTAHTADDQAETILHRILRGTGIAGLRGIPRARRLGPVTVIRPLLEIHRAELRAYLGDLGQPFRCDSSNADTSFTRNRLRLELLPHLADRYNSGVVEALLRLGRLAGEAHDAIHAIVEAALARHVRFEPAGTARIAAALAGESPYVVRETLMAVWRHQGWPLRAMGFDQWDFLAGMVAAAAIDVPAPRKRVFPGEVRAEIVGNELRVQRG
jgi:tRNA(Ile)-lysidine synthase